MINIVLLSYKEYFLEQYVYIGLLYILTAMWKDINVFFQQYPKQQIVAQKMLEYGLCIKEDNLYCGPIELSDSKVARALDIDRRAIKATIETIQRHPKLLKIFTQLKPTCHLRDMAREMGWDVLEIIPHNASQPGILAQIATIISEENISIRQAIVDDFEIREEPRLYVITETRIPSHIIPKIKDITSVKSVTLS
jgi:uncharacterized protein